MSFQHQPLDLKLLWQKRDEIVVSQPALERESRFLSSGTWGPEEKESVWWASWNVLISFSGVGIMTFVSALYLKTINDRHCCVLFWQGRAVHMWVLFFGLCRPLGCTCFLSPWCCPTPENFQENVRISNWCPEHVKPTLPVSFLQNANFPCLQRYETRRSCPKLGLMLFKQNTGYFGLMRTEGVSFACEHPGWICVALLQR